jgi:glyoxylase-like metal-dependent hydrolase (beta-lactamase superfamily II)
MTNPLSFAVGASTVHRIVEFTGPVMGLRQMLPELSEAMLAENRAWLAPDALSDDDQAILTFQTYVVRTPHHNILIDSCLGNDKDLPHAPGWHKRQGQGYEMALQAAGLRFEDIDYVFCTHLHADHVGWNTRLVEGIWAPTFPKARYVFSADEVRHWEGAYARAGLTVFEQSVLPVLEAGRADLVADDAVIGDHVRLLPTAGHTPHHVAVLLGKGRDEAAFAGDVLHTPLQWRYPDLASAIDRDAAAAAAVTRRRFLERFADTGTVCCFAHTTAPSAGFVRRLGAGFTCAGVAGT